MNGWLFFLGLAVLTAACRTIEHPLFRRLWVAALLGTSFYGGWLLFGHLAGGLVGILIWPALPWIELLTSIRSERIPIERRLSQMAPPSSNSFPALEDLTDEIESEGFEFLRDTGLEWGESKQNLRLFYREDDRAVASICLVSRRELSFFYLSISSVDANGTTWLSWNYPYAFSLKMPPDVRLNRQRADLPFFDMYQNHLGFLALNGVDPGSLTKQDADSAVALIERDQRRLIDHNLRAGILKRIDDEHVAYSFRGLFYLWTQFLVELLRAR